MSDASREADGYEVERSSADQHTAGEQGAENVAPIWCLVCEVSSEGGTYLAFINKHAHCIAPTAEVDR